MNLTAHALSLVVFCTTIILTFVVAHAGRRSSRVRYGEPLVNEQLNRWLVGLSAGATANSGFVVTGAVGLGYAFGLQWIMLPIGWLLGDLVFWKFFPQRINALGSKTNATTISDLLRSSASSKWNQGITIVVSVIVFGCLGLYISAQWLAGEKFVSAAFGLPSIFALIIFSLLIISYTAIGGFRGSVYADSYQAVLRLGATTVALAAVGISASSGVDEFRVNIASAGAEFLRVVPGGTLATAFCFTLGYAAASLGFGLGQPQIITRYMAASSPDETKAAKWIYIFFVQYTWIAMTLFGVILRGVRPGIQDPETGLAVFFSEHMGPVLTGIIIADIFATIAATSNSLVVAMTQTFQKDLLSLLRPSSAQSSPSILLTMSVGLITMFIALNIKGSVLSLALSSVAVMGAGLAPAVMVRLLGWRRSPASTAFAIILGFATAIAWKSLGFDATLNEAAPGILVGTLVNFVVARLDSHGKLEEELNSAGGGHHVWD